MYEHNINKQANMDVFSKYLQILKLYTYDLWSPTQYSSPNNEIKVLIQQRLLLLISIIRYSGNRDYRIQRSMFYSFPRVATSTALIVCKRFSA